MPEELESPATGSIIGRAAVLLSGRAQGAMKAGPHRQGTKAQRMRKEYSWLPHHPQRLVFCAVILLAAVLRLSHLDLVEFKADEANHLLRGLEIVEGHRLVPVGSQASLGIAKPPMMSLLMAIPLLVGRDPRLASGFIALLNVAAVAGCFLLARRYYSPRVAVIAATLLAVNPWAVVLSRKVFTADVLTPFLVLCVYALHAAIVGRRPWAWLVAALSLGIMLNITFSPLPLGLVLLVLLAIYRQRASWRHLAGGVALSGLLFVPYLYSQLSHLPDLRGLLGSTGQGGPAIGVTARALQYAIDLHSGRNIGSLAGASFLSFAPAHSPFRLLGDLGAVLFLASLVAIVALGLRARLRGREEGQAPRYAILAAWLTVPLLAVSLQNVAQQPHYLVILYPAGFLAMAVTLDRLWAYLGMRFPGPSGAGRLLRWALGALLGCLVAWQAYTVLYLYGFVARADTTGGYGAPLRYWQQIAGLARHEAASAGVNEVWVITDGTDASREEAPTILRYLLEPGVRTVFLGQGGNECLLLPVMQPAVYLLTRALPAHLEVAIEELGGEEKGTLPNPYGRAAARVVAMPAHSLEDVLALISERTPPWKLDSGLRLLGYQWPAGARPGDMVSFATYWAFDDVPVTERSAQHSLFNHLLTATGEKVTQRDGFGLPERYWREGLVLAQWYELPLPATLPAGDYTLLTGMYRLGDFRRNQVLDAQNQVVGDSIALGPVRVGH